MALGQNMPEIVKEKKLIENLDENSRKCLKNLHEILSQENKQQTIDASQQFDFKGIQHSEPGGSEFSALGSVPGNAGMGVGLGVANVGLTGSTGIY